MTGKPGKFARDTKTLLEIASYAQLYGNTEECFIYQGFGANPDIDAGQTEDVWDYGGTRATFTSAETFAVVSTSTADSFGGTGANIVLVQGLDADYNAQEEYIVMNGITGVTTVNTYIHIHRMLSATIGSDGTNGGEITATGSGTSEVIETVPAGFNISQSTHYVIPDGYTAYILSEDLSVYRADGSGTRQGEISTWIQIPGFAPFRTFIRGLNSATQQVDYPFGVVMRERSQVWHTCRAAINNTSVSVTINILCIRNDWVRNP